MKQLSFDFEPIDHDPRKEACELCGLMDATVHFFSRENKKLCGICAEQLDCLD